MKKLVRVIVALFICSTSIFSTFAYASSVPDDPKSTQIETSGVSDFFVNFTDKALSNIDTLSITNSKGTDVTNKYVKRFTEYYSLKDYKSIQELIENDGLVVSYEVREIAPNSEAIITPIATTLERFSKTFYHIAQDSGKKFPTKEWTSTISGSAVVDPSHGTVISSSSPTLSVDTNFGAAFDSNVQSISTGYTLHPSTIDYYASYHMTATLGVPIGDFTVGYPLDYGSYYDKFTAYPEF